MRRATDGIYEGDDFHCFFCSKSLSRKYMNMSWREKMEHAKDLVEHLIKGGEIHEE